MSEPLIIGKLAFGAGMTTMGLDVVCDRVVAEHGERVRIVNIDHRKPHEGRKVDVLFVSLYWWRDVYELMQFLSDGGIDPRQSKPTIVIGGMSAANPWCLAGYWHYAVIGDGEEVAVELVRALTAGNRDLVMDGLVRAGDRTGTYARPVDLRPVAYVEQRQNAVTRIELARGCRFRCPFCKLAFTKKYRELPFHVVESMVRTSSNKTVALYAPDRGSYSRFDEVPALLRKWRKRDAASDLRINQVKDTTEVDTVRFGLEGFTEGGRAVMKGFRNNEQMHKHLARLFDVKTPKKGAPMAYATCYLIADLPCERYPEIIDDFNETVLGFLDAEAERRGREKFTLFPSVSSFCPSNHTPTERDGTDPYLPFNDWWASRRARPTRIVVAERGGLIQPAARFAQLIVERGDERLARTVFWLGSTQEGRKLTDGRGPIAGRAMEKLITRAGVNPRHIYGELDEATAAEMPGGRIKRHDDMPKLTRYNPKKWSDGAMLPAEQDVLT